MTKTIKDEPPKLKIIKRDFTLRNVEYNLILFFISKKIRFADFENKPGKRTADNQQNVLSDKKSSSSKFSSIAGGTNSALEKAIKGIWRFLEGKTKMVLEKYFG